MPVYQHFQQIKKDHQLPMAQQVGACITCSYWDAEAPRPEDETEMVGLCSQPELKGFALIVSGSSACNHWNHQSNAGEEAEAYTHQGEAQA